MSSAEHEIDVPALSSARVAELVSSLASAMRQSDISELDLAAGALSIRLRRFPGEDRRDQAPVAAMRDEPPSAESPHRHVITAPMIGAFYASPTPGAPPFVAAGDAVFVGQTVGIIEAMKIMNEITADRSGTITAVLVGNGQPVEYGSPLFELALTRSDRP